MVYRLKNGGSFHGELLNNQRVHVLRLQLGLSKNPDINQMVFPRVIVFFLLSFFQVLASHPHETIHIVFSLWDITLQPPASHLFFGEKLASAKLAASNMSHKQYIMYMYEHRYRFFFLLSFSRVRTTYS